MNRTSFYQEKDLNINFGYVTYVNQEVATHVVKLGDKNEGFGERIVLRGKVCEIKPCRAGNDGDLEKRHTTVHKRNQS